MSLNKFVDSAASFAPNPPAVAGLPPGTPKEKYTKPQHLPSRVLVRHVLRTRVQAARAISNVLLELEEQDARLKAKYWLAERYGGEVTNIDHTDNVPEYERHWPQGARGAREVIAFLRGRGARFASAGREEHWAAALSGDEGDGKNGKTE